MVLGKLPEPGRPTSLVKSRARAYCSSSRCWWGLFGHFCSYLSFLFSFSLSLGGGGWSGGAKVLGKPLVPGRPTSLDGSSARSYCACNRCGWGFVWTFFL